MAQGLPEVKYTQFIATNYISYDKSNTECQWQWRAIASVKNQRRLRKCTYM